MQWHLKIERPRAPPPAYTHAVACGHVCIVVCSMHLKIERPRAAPREDSLWSILIATCVEDSSGRPCKSTKSSCIRMLTSGYVSSIRQHTSAYVSVRRGQQRTPLQIDKVVLHTYADVSIRQHKSAYEDSSGRPCRSRPLPAYVIIRQQHTSAYVSIRQDRSERPCRSTKSAGRGCDVCC